MNKPRVFANGIPAMGRLARWPIVFGVSVVIVLVTAGITLAVSREQGGAITSVRAVEGPDQTNTNSETFVNLPGAVTGTIDVPPGETALMLARFSGESQCGGGAATTVCGVRIVFFSSTGAVFEGLPLSADFAFDQVGEGTTNDLNEAHSMDRWRVVGPGTWRARVQYKVTDKATTFALDDWSLIFERSRRA